jgi:hypothetical protein
VRAVPLIALLFSIAIVGCAAPGLLLRTSTDTKPVFRAESSGLTQLESSAHQLRREDENKKRTERKSTSAHCNTCNSSPCSCSSESHFSGQMALTVLASPFTVPAMILGDDYDHFTEFPDYPYADDVPGSLLINSEFKGKKQTWSGNLQTFAIPGSQDLDRFGGRLLVENSDRIGIDTETNYWLQTHRHGGPDHAWNGDFNVVFRWAESEHFPGRAGVGFNWLADQTKPEVGVNFTYGVEWFPVRPWTISTVIDAGTIGDSSLFHNRTTAGVMLGATEIFAGYDYFQLGTYNFHGPVAGVGYRF